LPFLIFGLITTSSVSTAATADCINDRPRALVLSGGGLKGAFEAGAVYHFVVHRGCDFADIAGVSAGALNSAFLAQAPSQPDPLAALTVQAQKLVDFWRTIKDSEQIFRPRFGGLVRVGLGAESLNDFRPLWDLIRTNVSVAALRRSGRYLRVGVVSFWDGQYREVTPQSALLYEEQFLEYVFASALVPVVGKMPRIRESSEQPNDRARWAQFGDGGIRHNTPIVNYFPAEGFKLLKPKAGVSEIPPHQPGLAELFVVVASPYEPGTDEAPPPDCCPDPADRSVRSGREIVERALQLATDAPYRWDLNYALLANKALVWRDQLFEELRPKLPHIEFREFATKMAGLFPFESFHYTADKPWSLPYRLVIVAPERVLGKTFDVSAANIASQMREGCYTANKKLVSHYGLSSMDERCDAEFPRPPASR
jgi:hypothetical protein